MGVFEAHDVEQALDGAVLAGRAVERVEHHIGPRLGQPRGDVTVHVDPGDAVAERLQCLGHTRAGGEGDLALGGPAAHQHRNVERSYRHALFPTR